VATVRESLLVLDANLQVIKANKSFYQTFQVTPDETENRLLYDMGDRQWDIPKLRELLEKILPKNTAFNDFQMEHDFPTIGRRIMLLNARRIYREGNKTRTILLAIEDITERKQIEGELEKHRKHLGELVEASTAQLQQEITERKRAEEELRKTLSELERSNKELDNFVYTVSHDLKAPLVSLEGFASVLLDEHRERLDKDGQMYLERIKANVRKMGQLIEDLLDLSKVGRIVGKPEMVSMKIIVEEALERLAGEIEKTGVKTDIQENMPSIRCDRQRLIQVMQNLIGNAIKYTGMVKRPNIEVGAIEENDLHTFFVKDNGIGIDKQYHQKIFGLFQYLNPDHEGTGVGLTIVKRIIEACGGGVWVESEMGKGATFYFTVPKAKASEFALTEENQLARAAQL